MKKKNHDDKCIICHHGFKGCKKKTHMTTSCACRLGFGNGGNEKKPP